MRRIELPNWVYGVLEKHHNVALPNTCNKMNRDSLRVHLQKKTGLKIKIRQADIRQIDNFKFNKETKIKPYLIAEVR